MLLHAKESGQLTEDTHTIVEYSSGSTVISLAVIASIMGVPKVKAYMSNKTSEVKLNLLRFFVCLNLWRGILTHVSCRDLT